MSDLYKYQPSAGFEARLLAHFGRKLQDPHFKAAVRNERAEKILAEKTTPQNVRAGLLVRAKNLGRDQDRNRSLIGTLFLGGAASGLARRLEASPEYYWPEYYQDMHHPTPEAGFWENCKTLMQSITDKTWHWLIDIDPGHPAFLWSFGVLLATTQIYAIKQRSHLMKAISKNDIEPQLPFFDEDVQEDEVNEIPCEEDRTAPIPAAHLDTKHKPNGLKWQVEGATRTGLVREENQDDFAIVKFDDARFALILCDGAGGVEGGKLASQNAVRIIRECLLDREALQKPLTLIDLEYAIECARDDAKDKALTGVTTCLIALLDHQTLHYATLGDGALSVIWPDGMVLQLQAPHHTAGQPTNIINAYIGGNCQIPARTGTIHLEMGSKIMLMSDGASDLFPFEDYALNREEYEAMVDLPNIFLEELEAARDPDTGAYLHTDNMTMIIAQLRARSAQELGGEDAQEL